MKKLLIILAMQVATAIYGQELHLNESINSQTDLTNPAIINDDSAISSKQYQYDNAGIVESDIVKNDRFHSLEKEQTKEPSSLKSGFYIEGLNSISVYSMEYLAVGGGFSVGTIKFFNDNNPEYKFGFIGQSSLLYYYTEYAFMIDLFQVGPYLAKPIRNNLSLEYGVTNGLTMGMEFGDGPYPNIDFGGIIKLRISNLSIGFDFDMTLISEGEYSYNYQTNTEEYNKNLSSILRFGLKVGGKF